MLPRQHSGGAVGWVQEEVFTEVKDLVRSCADGYNVCILAYGQTGSGKTFTMDGSSEHPGINVRALKELFTIAAEEGREGAWGISVSMLEIYNDQVSTPHGWVGDWRASAGIGACSHSHPHPRSHSHTHTRTRTHTVTLTLTLTRSHSHSYSH
jgi:hypothetical protein